MVTANGDASAIWILLVGLDFADEFGVGAVISAVRMDVLVVDDEEVIGAMDVLASAIGASVNTLIEEAKFVGVGSVPDVCVFGVLVELAALK